MTKGNNDKLIMTNKKLNHLNEALGKISTGSDNTWNIKAVR